jgi:hypothetical protein
MVRPMRAHRACFLVVSSIGALAATGCSAFVSPHHVYAPLLDHAGQVDISARGGPGIPGGAGVSVNAAYAPIDHLEIVGGADLNVGDETQHYAGHLGIGTFVRDDVFRFELTAGSYAGYAEGLGNGYESGSSSIFYLYRITGPYVLPYGQVLLGFESGHFELAGGLRIMGSLADIRIDALGSAPERALRTDGYERMYIEPVVTARIPFDFFRIDLMTGWPINPRGVGDQSPGDLSPELDVMWYFAVGVGFQFDTIEPEPEPEPVYEPYPPAAYPPPAPVDTTPPPPSGYTVTVEPTPAPPATAPSPPPSIITPVPPAPESPPPAPPPP